MKKKKSKFYSKSRDLRQEVKKNTKTFSKSQGLQQSEDIFVAKKFSSRSELIQQLYQRKQRRNYISVLLKLGKPSFVKDAKFRKYWEFLKDLSKIH